MQLVLFTGARHPDRFAVFEAAKFSRRASDCRALRVMTVRVRQESITADSGRYHDERVALMMQCRR